MRGGGGGELGGLFLLVVFGFFIIWLLRRYFTEYLPQKKREATKSATDHEFNAWRLKRRKEEEDQEAEKLDALLDDVLPDRVKYDLWLETYLRANSGLRTIPRRNLDVLLARGWTIRTVYPQDQTRDPAGWLIHPPYQLLSPPARNQRQA